MKRLTVICTVIFLTVFFLFHEWNFPYYTSFRACWAYCVEMGCQYMLGFANLNKIDLIKGETFIHAVSEIVLKARVICIIEFEFYLKRKISFIFLLTWYIFLYNENKRGENKSEARPLFIFVSLYLNKVDCFQI